MESILMLTFLVDALLEFLLKLNRIQGWRRRWSSIVRIVGVDLDTGCSSTVLP
jgi:hypothetical protein